MLSGVLVLMLPLLSHALVRLQTPPPPQYAAAAGVRPHETTFAHTKRRAPPPRCGLFDDILQEAKLVRGGAVVEQPVLFDGDGDEAPFDIDRWNMHRSETRYGRLIPGILIGPTTRRISGTVAGLVVWSALIGFWNDLASSTMPMGLPVDDPTLLGVLPELRLPLTPFELTSPVLGLLLVFRTDTANDRFNLGCEAVWEITSSLRSLIRKLVAWTGRELTSDAEREAVMDLIDGSLLLHGWIMGSYLRGKALNGVQEAQLLRFAAGRAEQVVVPPSSDDAQVAMTPYLAVTALSLGVSRRLPSLTDQEEVSIDDEFGKITDALGKCEKLLRAPIPLGYTRYSVRFLWLWLSLLPFALVEKFEEFGAGTWWADKPQPVLAVAMLFVSFIFLSIEDIAVQIEEPFAVLPLIKCHKWLLADVRRMRSLVSLPETSSSSPPPAAGAVAPTAAGSGRATDSSSSSSRGETAGDYLCEYIVYVCVCEYREGGDIDVEAVESECRERAPHATEKWQPRPLAASSRSASATKGRIAASRTRLTGPSLRVRQGASSSSSAAVASTATSVPSATRSLQPPRERVMPRGHQHLQ